MPQSPKAARSSKAKKKKSVLFAALAIVTIFDGAVWHDIISARGASAIHDYFLDVGQGDSELVIFPGNIKVMTDAGPTDRVLASLVYALPPGDDYIDVAIISHPQLDHFNGYNFMLDHYRVGAFIYNGRDDDPGVKAWPVLKEKIKKKGIPFITLGGGDKIHIGASSSVYEIDMLSPSLAFDQSAELNDTGFVELIKTPEFRTLLSADIGFNIEDWLVENHVNIHADVLKVGHHGSKTSSGDDFLRAVGPHVAVIEVGAGNTYGHPGAATLERIASSTNAVVFRTDRNGTVEVWPEAGKLKIKKEK